MSCEECEKAMEEGLVAYYRVDRANVGIMGCREHVLMLFDMIERGKHETITEG